MIEYFVLKEMVPDWMIRSGIRKKLRKKLRQEYSFKPEERKKRFLSWIDRMKQGPIALSVEQPCELPATFFQCVLGRNLKFSSGFWERPYTTLDESEEAMLALTAERAQIQDGQKILDLGCGWGSLTLYLAKKFPNAQITAVSNSEAQRAYVEFQAEKSGYKNVKVINCAMNDLELDEKFNRVVSVEFFECMRNYKALLAKIAGFLNPGGKLFVHCSAHREVSYAHEPDGPADWVARHFFAGSLMPSLDIFNYFQDDFRVGQRWEVSGTHYQKTCRAWLELMDLGRINVKIILRETYGIKNVKKWWACWRIFFMTGEELFGYKNGKEWLISHTLLEKK